MACPNSRQDVCRDRGLGDSLLNKTFCVHLSYAKGLFFVHGKENGFPMNEKASRRGLVYQKRIYF